MDEPLTLRVTYTVKLLGDRPTVWFVDVEPLG